MVQAVIFDFDGVIVDTEPMHYEAFAAILPQASITLSKSEYFINYVGLADREIFQRILTKSGIDLPAEGLTRLQQAKDAAYRARVGSGIAAQPGVIELVARIAHRRPLAICSGSKRIEIEMVLAQIGLRDSFETIVSAEDVPASKPDPAGYFMALRRLAADRPNLVGRCCVAIEDSVHGIQAANATGMRVLAVRTAYNRDTLMEADAIVNSLAEVDERMLERLVE